MALQVLMVIADEGLAAMAEEAARRVNLQSDVVGDAAIATTILAAYAYDGLLVDCGSAGAAELLKAARRDSRYKVVVAVIGSAQTVHEACDLGATFVVRKPVTPDALQHTLNAAYGLMLGGKRRHWRCPVVALVEGATRDGLQVLGWTVNLSMEGMLLQTGATLRNGAEVDLRVYLPELEQPLALSGRVVWMEQGRAGVQFGLLGSKAREVLQHWITQAVQQLG
jgi:DNA-binding response OmpR family regulator